MNEDLKELLRLFNSKGIDYLVIGAHALAFYGYPRFTEDLDIWMARTEETAIKIAESLKEFGIPLKPGEEAAWIQERQMIRLGLPPNRVDLLNFGPDLPFYEVWERRVSGELDGIQVNFISRDDFVKSKRDAGRTKDLYDLASIGESVS